MKYLFLWLEGTLQSWGADSRFDFRKTMDFPTKSGIYGMLLASSGDGGPQEELLAQMADAPMSVVTFIPCSRKLQDFHMVGNGYDEKDKWQSLHIPRKSDGGKAVGGGAKLTYREYLQEQCFAVSLGLPDDLARKFSKSLQNPVFDLYLGRKCCVPSEMIFQGLFASEEEVWNALKEKIAKRNVDNKVPLTPQWLIREAPDWVDSTSMLLNDVPLRFGPHHLYRDRWVTYQEFEPSTSE